MLRKNEIPHLCRCTLVEVEHYDKGYLHVLIVTDNDKSAQIPLGCKRIGKSYLAERNSKDIKDYPYGDNLKNGTYVFNTNDTRLERWSRCKL